MNPPISPRKQPLILVVDDETALRLVLRCAMEGEGYQVMEAEDGDRALFVCHQQLPDIILLDAMMPGTDGFQCCQELSRIFRDRCPPILMITALYDQKSVDQAFAAGAIDYVTKPIHWAVLRQRVHRLLQAQRVTLDLQMSLERECQLTQQLADSTQKIKVLTELCQEHGLEVEPD